MILNGYYVVVRGWGSFSDMRGCRESCVHVGFGEGCCGAVVGCGLVLVCGIQLV